MSALYRDSHGMKCPRCDLVLAHTPETALVCGAECGTWLPNAVLSLDPAALMSMSRTQAARATPLPFSRCPVCTRSLTDLYAGIDDVLVIGQCLEDGVWVEGGDHALFEATFEAEIRQHEALRARDDADRASERAEQAYMASLPLGVADLLRRVAYLERTVEELYRKLDALKTEVRASTS